LSIITALWSLMFVTDSVQNILDRSPVFTLLVDDGEESRHATYVGMFYVVYVYEDPVACPLVTGYECPVATYTHVEMHGWFYRGN